MKHPRPTRFLFVLCITAWVVPPTAAEARTAKCFDRQPTIVGTDKDDEIKGTPRSDVILAKHGNDTIRSGRGKDFVCTFTGRDTVFGGPGRDHINGGPDEYPRYYMIDYHNQLYGGPGDDIIEGGVDEDYLYGGPGDDRMKGTPLAGDEFYPGPGNDVLIGGGGRELSEQSHYESDMAIYKNVGRSVRANVRKGVVHAQGKDILKGIRSIEGTEFDDVLVGDEFHNILVGWGGDDLIRPLGAKGGCGPYGTKCDLDFIWGGKGDDDIHGLVGGRILVAFDTSITPLHVDLELGTATGEGEDTLVDVTSVSVSRDVLEYTWQCPDDSAQSSLSGDEQDNYFEVSQYCSSGDYLVRGRGGSDSLVADTATSQIEGGEGDDFLSSSSGTANLLGGPGDDFLYAVDSDPDDNLDGGEGLSDECRGDAGDVFLNCESLP